MRAMKFTRFSMAVGLLFAVCQLGHAVTSPASLEIKVSKMWLATDSDCSNPVNIFDESANPVYRDFTANTDIGDVTVNNGTYQCAIIKMSDQIQFVPAADDGVCVEGTTYVIDVFRDGETSVCPDDPAVGGNTSSEDYPCVYVSRAGTSDPSSPFDSSSPFLLANDWVVSSDTTGTFVTDFNDKVEGNSQCDVQAPDFDFR